MMKFENNNHNNNNPHERVDSGAKEEQEEEQEEEARSNSTRRGSFDDLWELFHTMNATANWSDPDPGHFMIPNFISRQIPILPDDVVLATHTDVSHVKLRNLLYQAKRWGGPVSAVLYIQGQDGIQSLQQFFSKTKLPNNIGIHVMLDLPNKIGYPHNMLRNLAMEHLGSDFFFAVDVDFMPPTNSYQRLMTLMGMSHRDGEIMRLEMIKNKRLFVLPAFQIKAKENETLATFDLIPESKAELLDLVLENKAFGFDQFIFPCGHRPTDFVEWFRDTTTITSTTTTGENDNEKTATSYYYNIPYKSNFEPYVVGYRPGIPRYWPIIRGYGYDKISFFYELYRAGYSFAVLRDLYVVHLEHPSYRNTEEDERNKKKLKTFWAYLEDKYPSKNQKDIIQPKYKCFKKGWSSVMKDMRAK